MLFSVAGYNYLCEDLKDEILGKYEPLINDLVIHNMSLAELLSSFGFDNEYDALNASNNKRTICINTIKRRIELIEYYTEKYKKLTALYDAANITQMHSSTHKIDALQNSFTNAVVELVEQEKSSITISIMIL